LVLGDIYMHYKETTNTINIDDMLPMNTLTLNTSEEAVVNCISYLFTTYGESWNDLRFNLSEVQPKSNKNQDGLANFMSWEGNTYGRYCKGEMMEVYESASSSSTNGSDYTVKPISQSAPVREVNILTDYENGVLTLDSES